MNLISIELNVILFKLDRSEVFLIIIIFLCKCFKNKINYRIFNYFSFIIRLF